MAEREYAVWTFNPHLDARPKITPVGSSRHWAYRRVNAAQDRTTQAKVVYRYTFMPGMPWEDD